MTYVLDGDSVLDTLDPHRLGARVPCELQTCIDYGLIYLWLNWREKTNSGNKHRGGIAKAMDEVGLSRRWRLMYVNIWRKA